MFEKLENRAIIEYCIKTKSALHIGGHQVISPADVDNPIIKDSDDTPIVPGSSLKGVLRSEMERLLKGLNIRVCNSNKAKEMCNADKECPVCILFGGKELAASLIIRDATANSKRTIIRDGVAIDRKTRKAVDGGKYDVEAVPKGTEFNGNIIIENLSLNDFKYAKLGAFLSLVDFYNRTCNSLGHATSRGFGEVELHINTINLVYPKDYLDGNYRGTALDIKEIKQESIKDWVNYINSINELQKKIENNQNFQNLHVQNKTINPTTNNTPFS